MEKLKKVINAFLDKVHQKEGHKLKLIAELKQKISEAESQIITYSSMIVELEMNGKVSEAAKLEKEVNELNVELLTLQQKLHAYELTNIDRGIYTEELNDIRKVAKEAEVERLTKLNRLKTEKDELYKEVRKLQAKIEENNNEIMNVGRVEHELDRIREYIPTNEVSHLQQYNNPIFNWLNREEVEAELSELAERERIEKETVPSTKQVHTFTFQSIDKEATFKQWQRENPNATVVEVEGVDSSHGRATVKYTLND